MGYIMRLSATVSIEGGESKEILNHDIGDTTDKDWYAHGTNDAQCLDLVWSAVHATFLNLFDALNEVVDDLNEHSPSEYGIIVTNMREGK